MSVSVDHAKLESVMQFANFLDVLKDPQALKTTLTELQVASKELKALIETKTKIDQVDAYVADGQKQVKILRDILESEKGDFAKKVADQIKSEAEFSQYMQKSNDDLAQAKALVSVRERDVTKREVDVKEVEKQQGYKQKVLDNQKATQDTLQADLNEKATKLKALLG